MHRFALPLPLLPAAQISFLTRSSMLLMRLNTPSLVLGAKRANSIYAL